MASFSVMTWNVENLFPPGTKPSPQSKDPVSQAFFDQKIAFLSGVILAEQPDVIALQEVGGADTADTRASVALQNALGDQYPSLVSSQFPDSRHIRVVFLSKTQVVNAVDFRDFPAGPLSGVPYYDGETKTQMGRGALKVEVDGPGGVVIRLITAHLKSKLLTYPRGDGVSFTPANEAERNTAAGIALMRRAAEAVTLRRFANDLMDLDDGAHLIVLGDMNDGPLAATSQIIVGPSDRDVTSKDQGDKYRLINLVDSVPLRGNAFKEFVPEGERFSRAHEGRGEFLDQIFVDKGLVFEGGAWKVTEVRSLVDKIDGEVVGAPTARDEVVGPDHAPVFARFTID